MVGIMCQVFQYLKKETKKKQEMKEKKGAITIINSLSKDISNLDIHTQ